MTSSPGLTSVIIAKTSAPLVPLVMNSLRSAWAYSLFDLGLKFFQQRGDALGLRIAVFAIADGIDHGAAREFGNVEIGLADREVDRVFHFGREVENLADAGTIERSRTGGEPRMHGAGRRG